MMLFETLKAIVQLVKLKMPANVCNYIYDYEPAGGMMCFEKSPAIYIYDSETDIIENESEDAGDQDHKPKFYFDVIVSIKSSQSQSSGEITFSVDRAHQEIRNVVSKLYRVLMHQTFRGNLEKTISTNIGEPYLTGGRNVTRIEKLGVSKEQDSSQANVGYRLTMQVEIREINDGDDGIPVVETHDEIDPQTKIES